VGGSCGSRLAEVRAFAFWDRDSRLAPRRNALDAACQSVKGFFVVKRTVELYPRGALKKTRQIALFGPFATGQNHGQHA
jgi:hypothetical protein